MGTWMSDPITHGESIVMVIAHATGVHVVSEHGDDTLSSVLTPEKARQLAASHLAQAEALTNAASRSEALEGAATAVPCAKGRER